MAVGELISLDTEDTGIDLYHGAMPFFVTTANEAGEVKFWEWDVDPFTRRVRIPVSDVAEIEAVVTEAGELVLQNAKFDVKALATSKVVEAWPWGKTHDTLIAGHLLASNQPHDLTSMALQYLGVDIQPLENRLETAVKDARKLCKQRFPKWRIAERDLEGMPSAKEKTWKFDSWLPRTIARALEYERGHPWWTVLREYANADSAVTLPLWRMMRGRVEAEGLWPYYAEKVKTVAALEMMEARGTTVLLPKLQSIKAEYDVEIAAARADCEGIAARYEMPCPDHQEGLFGCRHCGGEGRVPAELILPKAGNNGSLLRFAFEVLKLPVLKWTSGGKSGKRAPSLDKDIIEEYKRTLPEGDQLLFVKRLSANRKRAKSCEFLEAYLRFGLPAGEGLMVLHASINPTATDTTRFSMSNPNLQQVSKLATMCEACLGDGCGACGGSGEDLHSVRGIFGPGPGREWWSADASNIELRLPAYESGERALIDLFERPGEPPFYGSQHLLNFSIIYRDIWERELAAVGFEKVGPYCKKHYGATEYHWTKGGGLAMQYQCGEETADRAFRRRGGYAKLKAHFRALDALNSKWVAYARKHGFIETIPDRSIGAARGYPLLCSRTEYGGILPTVPLNYHTQGTAGWWMHKAINRCQAKLDEWRRGGFDAFMALTVHDELVFDMPRAPIIGGKPGNLPRMRALQRLMEQGGDDIRIRTPVSVEYHAESWAKGQAV